MSHFFSHLWSILAKNTHFYGRSTTKSPFLWEILDQNVTLFSRIFRKSLKISKLTPVTLFCLKCHTLVNPNPHSTHFYATFTLILCHGPMSCLSYCDSLFWAKMSYCFIPKSPFYALLLPMSCHAGNVNRIFKNFFIFFPHPLIEPPLRHIPI